MGVNLDPVPVVGSVVSSALGLDGCWNQFHARWQGQAQNPRQKTGIRTPPLHKCMVCVGQRTDRGRPVCFGTQDLRVQLDMNTKSSPEESNLQASFKLLLVPSSKNATSSMARSSDALCS